MTDLDLTPDELATLRRFQADKQPMDVDTHHFAKLLSMALLVQREGGSHLTPAGVDRLKEAEMNEKVTCPVSGDQAIELSSTGDYREFQCPTCGHFRVSRTALVLVPQDREALQIALEVAKRATLAGQVPMISNVTGG